MLTTLSLLAGRIFELQRPSHARQLPMEGLRGLAVFLVFLQHYTVQARSIGVHGAAQTLFTEVFASWGNLGVELFFVLSGYLIYGTLVRKRPMFGPFMLRRYQRIYPTFLVVFALLLIQNLIHPVGKALPANGFAALLVVMANLALLPGLLPITAIVQVAWSLSYEMFFYFAASAAVMPAGFGRLSRPRRIAWILCGAIVFAFVGTLNIPYFPARMLPFFAGMLLSEDVGTFVPNSAAWLLPLLDLLASGLHLIPNGLGELVHSLCFFALCAVCLSDRGCVSRAMRWTPLRYLGNMSYSYYLIHGSIVRVAMLAVGKLQPHGLSPALYWALLPALFVCTLAGGTVLFVLVEKPFSLTDRRKTSSVVAPDWVVPKEPV